MDSILIAILILIILLVVCMALGFAIKVKDTDNVIVRFIKMFFKIILIGIPIIFILLAIF